MLVYEKEQEFVLVRQHDHAELASKIAAHWVPGFVDSPRKRQVVQGIQHHDRGWIDLDDHPLWNDEKHAPFSFSYTPVKLKIPFYRKGIDELEQMDPYAALISSLHYESFFTGEESASAAQFKHEEQRRQQKLIHELDLDPVEQNKQLRFHFRLLKLFDNLSIYLCTREPGRQGSETQHHFSIRLPSSEHFELTVCWKDDTTLVLYPFPLDEEIDISLPYREINKRDITLNGLANAYRSTPVKKRIVRLKKDGASI